MLKYLIYIILLWMCFPANAQSYFKAEYPSVLSRSGAYTLEVAEAMPEENYNFKPEGGSMSFREQLIHITQNLALIEASPCRKVSLRKTWNNGGILVKV